MRGGQIVHIVDLAARRGPAVIGMTVPRRQAFFALYDSGWRRGRWANLCRRWLRALGRSRRRGRGRRTPPRNLWTPMVAAGRAEQQNEARSGLPYTRLKPGGLMNTGFPSKQSRDE